MKKKIILLACFFLFNFFLLRPVYAIDPQYIFVRKAEQWSDCTGWSTYNQDKNKQIITDIINKVGTKGTTQRKLGIGVFIFPNHVAMNTNKICLQNIMDLSLQNDFPIYISFDDTIWWDGRPDLWYWWDPTISAQEKAKRRQNVEWVSWDGDTNDATTMKLSWLNWGRQIRMKPIPNLLSPTFITNEKSNFDKLIPLLVTWYQNLPVDKKYLLGGIDIGNEINAGGGTFYANGNSYLNQPESNDPKCGLNCTMQTGYAALKISGIKSSGTITKEDQNRVAQTYTETMDKYVYSLGVPRNKIFNHTGGNPTSNYEYYPSNMVVSDITTTKTAYGYPGASLYGNYASTPQNNTYLNQVINDEAGATEWASPEWFPPANDYTGWVTALHNTLNYRNNRFLNVANWDSILNTQYAINAIRTVLNETPPCWETSTNITSVNTAAGSVTLNWVPGTNNSALYLNISTSPNISLTGALETTNIANTAVTGQNTYTKTGLSTGTYYWLLASDGCSPVQRRLIYGSFNITSNAPATKTYSSADLRQIQGNFGKTGLVGFSSADLNNNGSVDIFDFNNLSANYAN